MSDNTVVLYKAETGEPEAVSVDKAPSLLVSGAYYRGKDTHVREGGTEKNVEEAGYRKQAGAVYESGADQGVREREQAREESFDNLDDKMQAFLSGGADALSFGFIHAHSDVEKENLERNSKYAFAGQVAGTALQLGLTGGLGGEAEAGEAAGKAAVAGITSDAAASTSAVSRIGAKAITEAAQGAALGAAHATGYGIADSVVENKPLTIEAFSEEVGIGGLMGFVGGGIAGALERGVSGVSRGALKLQGGVLDPASSESRALVGLTNMAHGELDKALESYSTRVGGLRELADQGYISEDMVGFREDALAKARKAQAKLDKFDTNVINDPKSPAYEKWKQASVEYHDAVQSLHEVVNSPGMLDRVEAGMQQVQELKPMSSSEADAARAEGVKIQDNIRSRDADPGTPGMGVVPQIQAKMTPELEAQYRALHGQDLEDPRSGYTRSGHASLDDTGRPVSRGEENLGGQVTPTSADRTNPGKMAKGTPSIEPRGGSTEQIVAPISPEVVGQKFAEVKDQVFGNNPGDQVPTAEDMGSAVKSAQFDSAKTEPELGGNERRAGLKAAAKAEDKAKVEGAKANKEASDKAAGQKKVQDFINRWYEESKKLGPRLQPFDEAEMRIHNLLFDLNDKMGGKLDTVAGTFNWRNAGSSLTERIDQVRQLREMASMAADEARGVKTKLRDMAGKEANEAGLKAAALQVAKVGAGAYIGDKLVGGKAGYFLGAALAGRYAGIAGKLGATAGKIAEKARNTASALLSGRRSVALAAAATRNVAYQYTPDGPEKDPVKRIQQIQELAQRPDEIIQNSLKQAGDLAVVHPEIAQGLAQQAVKNIQTIAMMAPAIYFNQLGDIMQPNTEAMRKFLECENATHNPGSVMDCIANGSASNTQIQSLKISAPAMHMELLKNLMSDPERLKKMGPVQLRMMEKLMDQPLTMHSAPDAVMRSQGTWMGISAGQQMAAQQQNPGALALKGAQEPMTPGQASSTAPGNQ